MIRSLQLENFKCFEDELISLSNLNLLAGLNGMGKSSVIQSLLLLRQNFENGLLLNQHRLGLNGEYANIGGGMDLLYKYYKKKEIGIALQMEDENSPSWKWQVDDNTDSLNEVAGFANNLERHSLFNAQFHYLSAERIGPRSYYETSSYKVIHQNQLGVRGEFATNYFSVNRSNPIAISELHYEFDTKSEKDYELGYTLYEQVNAWLNIIRPGAQARIKDQPEAGTNTLSFDFVVAKDNAGPYRAQNVGFGITYVFPLIVAILSSKPGTLLLIENPEAHIHPKGQAELGILLAKAAGKGLQIIVETHSDHILNGIRYATKLGLINNHLVRLMFFTGVVANNKFQHYIDYIGLTEDGKLTERPENFFDVWDEMLTKLI